ncbi:MAG TPA: 1,4-alpha-glucan branching protein domain-containing protein [Methylomirabilota bacterium]|jgi:1,4-alpha-glucan branching enzyme|nr:1,4-alpha-glucan branching protein domain-containing protein [Methylomirabilota bacterium]
MGYPFALVLHTHLPMVVNHGRWPHGSDWLNEAAFECYLPLLEVAHRLVADGVSPKWTLNLSPVLTEQLASPEFQKELAFYYDNVRRSCADTREYFRKEGPAELMGLCDFWEEHYERMWELHRRIGGDIPGTFAELQRGRHVEIITCAATHGYLPLLSRDESIHQQLRTAVETHTRHFGVAPRGIWLPECAYRPRYEWTPPTGRDRGRERRLRPGIEEMLAMHDLEYFVADSHLVAAGEPVFLYRDYIPMRREVTEPTPAIPVNEARSPYAPYRVASRGGSGSAVAFIRDPKTTLQVWSRDHGYPGEYAYLEFHKKHWPGGLRFWRITDNRGDFGTKQPYDPKIAAEKAALQASHFAGLVRETVEEATRAEGRPALVCSPYDSELFGHWWFEGPIWLEHVARAGARDSVTPVTLGEALQVVPPRVTLSLPEGSWGEGGDHRVWLNRDTEWTWDRVYSAEAEWVEHIQRGDGGNADLKRVLAQATRELLLLQSSDWQFLITTGSARDYAERRVAEHYAEFKRLSEMASTLRAGEPLSVEAANTLRRLEREDFVFPDLDPAWAQAPAS